MKCNLVIKMRVACDRALSDGGHCDLLGFRLLSSAIGRKYGLPNDG